MIGYLRGLFLNLRRALCNRGHSRMHVLIFSVDVETEGHATVQVNTIVISRTLLGSSDSLIHATIGRMEN